MTACWRCTAEAGHAPFAGSSSGEGESPPFFYFLFGSMSMKKTEYQRDCEVAILVNLFLLIMFAAAVITDVWF